MEEYTVTYDLRFANILLTDEDRERIVRDALENLDGVLEDPRKNFLQVARKYIRIKGFRPGRIPYRQIDLILSPVTQCASENSDMLSAILPIWIDAQRELQENVIKFLENEAVPVQEAQLLVEGFKDYWTIDELELCTERFLDLYPGYQRSDVSLMLCCLTNKAPIPDDVLQEIQQHKGETMPAIDMSKFEGQLWEKWIKEINNLPQDAPEWETMKDFLDALMEIIKQRGDLFAAGIAQLQERINTLAVELAETLEFFGMSRLDDWEASLCDVNQIGEITHKLDEFKGKLLEYQQLYQQPAPSIKEERNRRIELERIETEAMSLYETLSSLLLLSSEEGEEERIEQGEPDLEPSGDQSQESYPETIPVDTFKEGTEEEIAVPVPGSDVEEQAEDIVEESIFVEVPEEEERAIEEPEKAKEGIERALPEDGTGTEEIEKEAAKDNIEDQIGLDILTDQDAKVGLSPLKSAREAASDLLEQEGDERLHSLLWSLISEGDIAGAYWLSRSLLAQSLTSPVPPWLLEAMLGSQLLSSESDNLVMDLLKIANNYIPEIDGYQGVLGLGVAIRPSLVAPYSGLIGWIRTSKSYPELNDFVQAITRFASLDIALRPEDISGVSGAQQRESNILDAVREAERWLESASSRRLMLKRTSDIWHHLVRPGGELRNLLLPVAKDNRKSVDLVREMLHAWDRDGIEYQIDHADKEIHKLRTQTLYGRPRDQLRLDFLEAYQIARRWCDLVLHEKKITLQGNWIFDQIEELRKSIQNSLPGVSRLISVNTTPETPASIKASFQYFKSAIAHLLSILQIQTDEFVDVAELSSGWYLLSYGAVNLSEALNKRLLMFPEIELSNQFEPTPESIPHIATCIRDSISEKRTLVEAYQAWIDKQDYRFIDLIIETLQDVEDVTELKNRYHEAKEGSRLALKENIALAENLIEQAVVDGIIAEERSEYSALVESIDLAQVLNFSIYHQKLKDLRATLENARQARLKELQEGWMNIAGNLEKSEIDAEKRKQIEELVSTALEKQDTRLLEEILARLTEILDSGGKIEETWFAPPVTRDELADFTNSMLKIEDWIKASDNNLKYLANDLRNGKTVGAVKFAEVSPKRREEAYDAVLVWRQLKGMGSNGRSNPSLIAMVLSYLGFTPVPDHQSPVEVIKTGKDWLYVQANVSASELAKPIPQFGSLTKNKYHIICLWERPGPETISARLRELRLKLDSVIVFYLGRLTLRQRYELIRTSTDQELALAVLDDILLLYLAQERDIRLPAFMKCSLPFSAVNPYTPFQAGDVPPEMFFGREVMVRELLRPQGSSLVFGGRQLGKSALLRRVEREFHNPAREQYAHLEDIKLIGDPLAGQPKEIIWRRLRDALRDVNLISTRITTDNPDEIERYIRDAMSQDPSRRVILLFDEADNFLDADAKGNFQITERLRVLMFDTQRRFKVVFAGLHNVQRFQGIANQPLAHFGTPLCVGPLEPDAAYQLVQRPLEYLGCRFADEAAPLRILSYTNYHPGLIQLFCQVLLNSIRSRSRSSYPPYEINQGDIEAVYRQVRDRIRERFDWTLALDMRYQAIAWSLIVDQMEMRDSYAVAYPPGEILRLVREWWPQGFNNVATEELRSLMDEMVGLGVLVRSSNGQYRLRSPNLVRLMGTEADIGQQLLELVDKQPPALFEADYHHAPLDERAKRYSVFTYSQERSLNAKRFGVGLVFCSEALGWSNLLDSIGKFVPIEEPLPQGSFKEIPLFVANGEDLYAHLDKHLRTYPDRELSVLYYRPVQTNPNELMSLLEGALEFCKRRQSKKKILRLFFLLDPTAAWAWHSISPAIRKQLEDNCDAVISPAKWNLVGIRQRLAQHDIMHSDKICEEVFGATGGWPILLNNLFDRCGSKDDPRPFAEQLKIEIHDSNSQLQKEFIDSIGINDKQVANIILRYLFEGEYIPREYVNPELVGGEYSLTEEECNSGIDFLRGLRAIDQTGDVISVDPIVRSVLTKQ